MHTDDQLAHDLGEAFRAATRDLTYAGPVPTPRRSPLVAAPIVVAGTAGVALVLAPALHSHHSAGVKPAHQIQARGPAVASSSATPAGHRAGRPTTKVVTEKLTLAGYTLVYSQPAGDDPLVARVIDQVPADATPIASAGPAKDYLGVDPDTGDNAAFVDVPGGMEFSISGADATKDELIALMQSDQPRAVPLVGASDS
jgi:hypothetical protein